MSTASITKIEDRLNQMKDKCFLYNGNPIRILNFRINDSGVTIATDKRFFDVKVDQANQLLSQFLEAENENTPAVSSPGMDILKTSVTLGAAAQLKDILMDNIKKVQEDPAYIPQATAVNENVKSMIELAKAEVNLIVAASKVNS